MEERPNLAETVVSGAQRSVRAALRMVHMREPDSASAPREPGASPGIESAEEVDRPPEPGRVRVRSIEYGPADCTVRDVDDLAAFLAEPRPEGRVIRWIDVVGLHPWAVNRLREALGFHTLAAEDVLHVPQRSKVEDYGDSLFVVAHMLSLGEDRLQEQQVSLFLLNDTLLTFREQEGDVWDPIRKRLQVAGSRIRSSRACYLLYALVDGIVDNFFPILEHYGDVLEEIEERLIEAPTKKELDDVYGVKRELVLLRRVIWPMRQVADDLVRTEFTGIQKATRPYLRDVHDHTLQVMDVIETYREMASGLTDLYMTSISNRMNEVMKVLTIMASLFIPITFLAGVYGMNFEHIPELSWVGAYSTFWIVCLVVTVALLVFFRRKGWIGGG